MPFVDPGSLDALLPQCTHNHFSMFISGELGPRAGDAPIEVSLVVEDSAAT